MSFKNVFEKLCKKIMWRIRAILIFQKHKPVNSPAVLPKISLSDCRKANESGLGKCRFPFLSCFLPTLKICFYFSLSFCLSQFSPLLSTTNIKRIKIKIKLNHPRLHFQNSNPGWGSSLNSFCEGSKNHFIMFVFCIYLSFIVPSVFFQILFSLILNKKIKNNF